MVKMLVTGATGGIGRGLVRRLAGQGAEILANGRNPVLGHALEQARVRFFPADLASDDLRPLLDGVEIVIHLAARSAPWGKAEEFDRDNVVATQRLLDAASAAGVRRFVHASTPAIFAERRHRLGLRAESPPAERPANHYARTKWAAERKVRDASGMETLVLRPSAVIGPDDQAILPRLMRVVRRGFLPLGNGGQAVFHPTDARDAVDAFAAAAFGRATGVANIAGNAPVAIASLARALAGRLGIRLFLPIVPEPVLDQAARLAEWRGRRTGREPAITGYSATLLSWSRTFDIEETERLIGWRPAFGPEQALASAVPARRTP